MARPCADWAGLLGHSAGGMDDYAQEYYQDGYYYRYFVLGEYNDENDDTALPNFYGRSDESFFPFTPICLK